MAQVPYLFSEEMIKYHIQAEKMLNVSVLKFTVIAIRFVD